MAARLRSVGGAQGLSAGGFGECGPEVHKLIKAIAHEQARAARAQSHDLHESSYYSIFLHDLMKRASTVIVRGHARLLLHRLRYAEPLSRGTGRTAPREAGCRALLASAHHLLMAVAPASAACAPLCGA